MSQKSDSRKNTFFLTDKCKPHGKRRGSRQKGVCRKRLTKGVCQKRLTAKLLFAVSLCGRQNVILLRAARAKETFCRFLAVGKMIFAVNSNQILKQ
jgi:hypothetical protein